jgi:AefR-like transcriptional repressor, C-terminal domain
VSPGTPPCGRSESTATRLAEAERFPQIGGEYYERSWVRTLKLLAQALSTLTARGLLAVADPDRAAYTFTWLIVGVPANKVAFLGDAAVDAQQELLAHAEEGARVFLAAYGAHINCGDNPSRRKDSAGSAAPARQPQRRSRRGP